MSTLERAIVIAAEAHAEVKDKGGSPYILHPLRVMALMDSDDARIVAVLHDVVEDSHWTLDALREEGFSEAVLAGIDAVTRRTGESYDDFVQRAGCDEIGRKVKIGDLLDNSDLSRIPTPTDRDRQRQAKYKRALSKLA
ncbi:HD domain-containing protein [Pandoraea communis]|uniref:HD domain-containing protein n=1 Tax=Pandoraea communis TaxID=2508297 RepID=UPI0025A4CE82|nr:HD domain-containing protein [Pandoraea communis]MDM8356564.1 HD domain-containing protein [Pandoraea communis]